MYITKETSTYAELLMLKICFGKWMLNISVLMHESESNDFKYVHAVLSFTTSSSYEEMTSLE